MVNRKPPRQKLSSPPPSSLEHIFGFEDSHFRNYMAADYTSGGALLAFRNGMAESDHPLVRYAAGWATAEVGLHYRKSQERESQKFVPINLDERLAALATAQAFWEEGADGLRALAEAQHSPGRMLRVQGIDIRRRQALAYIPLMGVAASWLADKPMSPHEIQQRQRSTKSSSLALAREVSELDTWDDKSAKYKAGWMAEVVGPLVGQYAHPLQHLLLPASIREGHKLEGGGDFVAISSHHPHRRVPVPIVSSEAAASKGQPFDSQTQVPFIASRDFVLKPGTHVYRTLDAITDIEAGTRTRAAVVNLAQAMMLRFYDFHRQLDHPGS